ncbi:hypothetical protein EV189_3958 [Motilibacter rhizosphaerae]|uniref:Uncharacterized protein n=1 Tax=Motilibacter rhizosphaerae TaxID=598652 RepID=A0A4Q7N7G8_9ACTN|nr:hypothetical protein [Motilibacter rhizosphaerae]RZS77919.1 hypothetical protein EV189_3958 [Motilibacter rhizosphaerae]
MDDRRQRTSAPHPPAQVALGLAALFTVAWVVKDLLAGTGLLHALVAGLLTGACAGAIYWVVLRVIRTVGDAEDD